MGLLLRDYSRVRPLQRGNVIDQWIAELHSHQAVTGIYPHTEAGDHVIGLLVGCI
jgi:hypothetical protein